MEHRPHLHSPPFGLRRGLSRCADALAGGYRRAALGAVGCLGLLAAAEASAESEGIWEVADRRGAGDDSIVLFVEEEPTPGRPTFRLETRLAVPPAEAHRVLVEGMLDPKEAPSGQQRKVLERSSDGAVVYTFLDLPLMLSDRELVLRVKHSHDASNDVHRVEWNEANELLPPSGKDVVRLEGAAGFWEFRPDGRGGTAAVHMTRTELGGSFPAALGDRLMKSQAVEAVEKLRERVDRAVASDVAAGPP
jgi:hypothetical protein